MLLHKLPLGKRIRLYREAMALHSNGLLPKAIEERFRATYGYSVASANINRWVYHGARPDTRAHTPSFTPSPQLSYFIGAYKGDGYHYNSKKRRTFRVGFRVKDEDFANHASEAVAHVLGRRPLPLWTVKGQSGPDDKFYTFSVECWALRPFLMQNSESLLSIALAYPREFLRGVFDAEGYVTVSREDNRLVVNVGMAMSDRKMIVAIQRTLQDKFGIHSTGPYRRKPRPTMIQGHFAKFTRTTFDIRISRRGDLKKFAKDVGFSIWRKQGRLWEALRLLQTTDSKKALVIWSAEHTGGIK